MKLYEHKGEEAGIKSSTVKVVGLFVRFNEIRVRGID